MRSCRFNSVSASRHNTSWLTHHLSINTEVLLACTTQALTTEAEEVMGLLLGWTSPLDSTNRSVAVHVARLLPQRRVDRRKDRVETSPEQLAHAAELAAAESARTGQPCKVVGWFHSHPHITVLPSHVDVATQARFQQFADPGWIGLIASVFNDDAGGGGGAGGAGGSGSREQRVSVSAFQSREAGGEGGTGGEQQRQQEQAAAAALEGLDEATRRAILEAAGGDLSAALAGTTQATGGGNGGAWLPRLVPLVVAAAAGGEEVEEGKEGPRGGGGGGRRRGPKDYSAIFRNLLEEERFASAQRSSGRRREGADAEADASSSSSPRARGREAASLLEAVRAGARHQRGVCALVSQALAPAVHLARLQVPASAVFAGAERETALRLRERAELQRRKDEAARAGAMATMSVAAAAGDTAAG